MANSLDVLCALGEVGLWLLLLGAGWHLGRSGLWAWNRTVEPPPRLPDGERPRVTVMLPIRNERHVAERTVRAVAALAWPRERLEVQVLDDSDDDTAALLDRLVAELAQDGVAIALLRRGDRRGFKAGNLEHGLAVATGEYVCVLDADCVPPPDFLERLLAPLLGDPSLGFTQARWEFRNEGAAHLTRVQALLLDGLFLVEQSRQTALGRRVQWNGTAGVWRRAALERAGGFFRDSAGALTEDLELTARAERAGFRGRMLPGVAVSTELPAGMASFRAQQKRWVAGAGQVLRSKLRRGGALAHLLRHARQPVLLLAALWLPATTLDFAHPFPAGASLAAWVASLGAAHVGLFLYYGAARRRRRRSALPALAFAPVLVALSVGLSLALTAAYLGGLSGRAGTFVRTAKSGNAGAGDYRPPLDPLAFVETAVGVAYLAVAGLALVRGSWLAGAASLGWMAGGFLWVGIGSLRRR